MENNKDIGKGKIYKGIKILAFFCILILLVSVAGKVTQRKESVKKYSDFWELAPQTDVLFLGSSHMLNGISPLQLYAEYGITSYNMAKHGGMATESYWMLMNALDYCEPKCVVVDLWALDRDYQYIDLMDGTKSEEERNKSVSFFHDNIDSWPLTKTKIAAVNDLISEYNVKKEFFWDFSVYHDRWSSLGSSDFQMASGEKVGKSYLGASPVYLVGTNFSVFQAEKMDETVGDTVCVQYLYKIIEECEKRDIEVIFTFLPMAGSYEQDWKAVNTGKKIAEEKGILFLDMLSHETQNIINYKLDMFDEGHANNSGMRKLTSYIGKYLCEVEGIIDHREDEAYQAWGALVSQWQTEEIQRLLGEKELYIELSMIQNLNANTIIFMPGNSSALQDSTTQDLVMQLAGTTAVLEAAQCGGPYLLIRDASSGAMQKQEFVGEQQIESFMSILGDTHYIAMKDFSAVYANGNLEYNYLDMEEHYDSEVQITILGQAGEIMSRLYYDPVWDDMEQGNVE